MPKRSATRHRTTKETDIKLTWYVDANGPISINTGLPFFDHMLTAFACHGQFGLELNATGDIAVDPHHLIEDVGIALGEAIREALPDYSGIQRAGCFSFPMDGTLATVALDLCGRPNLVYDATYGNFTLGGIDPNLFKEFFKGLVDGARITVHINVPVQDNDHHVVESIFKAFARSLRQAVEPLNNAQPLSTKGTLNA
jgi:imidazoleglycerol-phosphate dehydratase